MDCFNSDNGNIEAHILVRLGDFDHDSALARKQAAAFDRVVCAFERLDRYDRSVIHDHSLANVESCNFLRYLPAKLDIFFFAMRKLWSRDQSRGRNGIFEKSRGR